MAKDGWTEVDSDSLIEAINKLFGDERELAEKTLKKLEETAYLFDVGAIDFNEMMVVLKNETKILVKLCYQDAEVNIKDTRN